uniref:transposase n=1 Tax=Caballeronia calidae TaxID=1777139 RepID=UPI001E5273F6|nr:transposase [Caballeronia calidae]
MNENQDLRSRLVVGQKRDGRREVDEDAVRGLVALCLKPGVSIARAAMENDVNPNQLRRWSRDICRRSCTIPENRTLWYRWRLDRHCCADRQKSL